MNVTLTTAQWVRLSMLLAFVIGVADILAWLSLGKFFIAIITSDLIISVAELASGEPLKLMAVLAIPTYLIGVVAGYFVNRSQGGGTLRAVRVVLTVEVVLFGGATVLAVADGRSDPTGAIAIAIALNVVRGIVGLLDAATRTGDGPAKGLQAAADTLPAVGMFLVGVAAGTTAHLTVGPWAWALPAVFLLVVLIVESLLRTRPKSGPTHEEGAS